MSRIQIPETIEAATTALNGIDTLLTAKGWERSAIVWAFTYEEGSNWWSASANAGKLTCEEFAALGIHGLSSAPTVLRIRRYWQHAIKKEFGEPVTPGSFVDLPDPTRHRYPGTHLAAEDQPADSGRLVDRLRQDAPPKAKFSAIQEVITSDSEVGKLMDDAFVRRCGEDHVLAGRVFRAYAEHNVTPEEVLKPVKLWADMGFGSSIYEKVRLGNQKLERYLLGIAAHRDHPDIIAIVQTEIDDLEKAEGLIRTFADKLRASIGVDADAVFNRLVGR
jgi:hypothetical protein